MIDAFCAVVALFSVHLWATVCAHCLLKDWLASDSGQEFNLRLTGSDVWWHKALRRVLDGCAQCVLTRLWLTSGVTMPLYIAIPEALLLPVSCILLCLASVTALLLISRLR